MKYQVRKKTRDGPERGPVLFFSKGAFFHRGQYVVDGRFEDSSPLKELKKPFDKGGLLGLQGHPDVLRDFQAWILPELGPPWAGAYRFGLGFALGGPGCEVQKFSYLCPCSGMGELAGGGMVLGGFCHIAPRYKLRKI